MDKATSIRKMIDMQRLDEADEALRTAGPDELSSAERYYIEGLLAAKRGDWKTAKNRFLKAESIEPGGRAGEMLAMLTNIYDFYYKDNLNP